MIGRQSRAGFSLLETVLFLGILSIMSGTVVAVQIATQEARLRQRSAAALEQNGIRLLETISQAIRGAESVLAPAVGSSGSILALQRSENAAFPTILASGASGGILLIEKSTVSLPLPPEIAVVSLQARNVGGVAVVLSLQLATVLPTIPPSTYARSFATVVTLLPDDRSEAGGCGSCPAPVCQSGSYRWNICENGTCVETGGSVSCR